MAFSARDVDAPQIRAPDPCPCMAHARSEDPVYIYLRMCTHQIVSFPNCSHPQAYLGQVRRHTLWSWSGDRFTIMDSNVPSGSASLSAIAGDNDWETDCRGRESESDEAEQPSAQKLKLGGSRQARRQVKSRQGAYCWSCSLQHEVQQSLNQEVWVLPASEEQPICLFVYGVQQVRLMQAPRGD